MDKHSIIKLKQQGHSNRAVHRMTGINRETVGRYWNDYLAQEAKLNDPEANVLEVQEKMVEKPKYDSTSRVPKKYTDTIDKRLDQILEEEKAKDKLLGNHKQNLTKEQIHKKLVEECFDIGYTTIATKINLKLAKFKECFIKQLYDFGDRLEFDFGEVKLEINGVLDKYYLAVLSSPGGDFRWAFLYKNQKKDVFMDAHVRFFEMMGGVYKEVVYDNMRNVVTKFVGRNEKLLNEDLIKMSMYYGFDINVTNCFSGNEKGFVEGSVKIIRNAVFAVNYKFLSFEQAETYLNSQLLKLNEGSKIEEEKKCLLPHKPKLELGIISDNDVNSYSWVRVSNKFYSVPDYLVGRKVTVKSYFNKVVVYSNNSWVCEHKKVEDFNEISIDITHYLNTLIKKPGAIKNSLALKSIPMLKSIYDSHFNTNPKKFIEILRDNKERSMEEILIEFKKYTHVSKNAVPVDSLCNLKNISQIILKQMAKYDQYCVQKGDGVYAKH